MHTDRNPQAARPSDLDLTQLPFWRGYRAWLKLHRRGVWIVGVTLVLVFLALLIASSAPQDPFTYDIY